MSDPEPEGARFGDRYLSEPDGPCGSETCWHAVNGRQCPPDPWPEADLLAPRPPAILPTDPPF